MITEQDVKEINASLELWPPLKYGTASRVAAPEHELRDMAGTALRHWYGDDLAARIETAILHHEHV